MHWCIFWGQTVKVPQSLPQPVYLYLSAELQLASLPLSLLLGNVPPSPAQIHVPSQPELMSALPGACHIRRGNNPWNNCSFPPTLLPAILVSPLFPNSPLTFFAPCHTTLHLTVGPYASQRCHLLSMCTHTHTHARTWTYRECVCVFNLTRQQKYTNAYLVPLKHYRL